MLRRDVRGAMSTTPGPSVLACPNVRRNTICETLIGRRLTVAALGEALGAVTSCGSTRSNLRTAHPAQLPRGRGITGIVRPSRPVSGRTWYAGCVSPGTRRPVRGRIDDSIRPARKLGRCTITHEMVGISQHRMLSQDNDGVPAKG